MRLCDSNVLLDLFNQDARWVEWSMAQLKEGHRHGGLAINALIYAEISSGFSRPSKLDALLDGLEIERLPLPYEAAFLAGKAFLAYRKRGGVKRSPLPDFYIGAHAQIAGLTLLTRDATRYRTYFPQLPLVAPEE